MTSRSIIKNPYTLEAFQAQVMQFTQTSIRSTIEKCFSNELVDQQIKMIEKTIKEQIAILGSMTIEEKKNPNVLNTNRLQRIANGSGTKVTDVIRLLKQYQQMKNLMLKLKPKGNEPPPAKAAVMPIPKEPVITKAIGQKYRT